MACIHVYMYVCMYRAMYVRTSVCGNIYSVYWFPFFCITFLRILPTCELFELVGHTVWNRGGVDIEIGLIVAME